MTRREQNRDNFTKYLHKHVIAINDVNVINGGHVWGDGACFGEHVVAEVAQMTAISPQKIPVFCGV